jgi:hypothetical protein
MKYRPARTSATPGIVQARHSGPSGITAVWGVPQSRSNGACAPCKRHYLAITPPLRFAVSN